jgi:CheY-like chemotaxis protein
MTAIAASDSDRAPLEAMARAEAQQLAVRLMQRRDPAPRSVQYPQPSARAPELRSTSSHRLALYQRPGSLVLLDDAPGFLDMLVAALPRRWNVETFVQPQACLNYLQQEPPRWDADLWAHQRLVENWHKGQPLIRQILQYWTANPERYALTRVCVFDQTMPAMTGLQALEELVDWPGHRILLTGNADERLATEAFNRRLIDQFIAKQSDQMSTRLAEAIQMLMDRPNPRYHQIWSATLSPEQQAILREPSIAEDLANFAGRTFAEWVVIGDPFGILGLSDGGVPFWLQLEPTTGLHALARLAERQGAGAEDVSHIREGRCVYDAALLQSLGSPKAPSATPGFYIGDAGMLLAAIHRIDGQTGAVAALSYSGWLLRHRRSMNQSRF